MSTLEKLLIGIGAWDGKQALEPKKLDALLAYTVWSLVFEKIERGTKPEEAVLSRAVRNWLKSHSYLALNQLALVIESQHAVWLSHRARRVS